MNTKDLTNEQRYQLAARLLDAIEAAEFEEDVADFRDGIVDPTIRVPSLDDIKARLRKSSLSFVDEWRERIARWLQVFEGWGDVPQYGYGANKDRKYFGERLTIHYDTVDETEQQITLRSTDPAFADSFLVLG